MGLSPPWPTRRRRAGRRRRRPARRPGRTRPAGHRPPRPTSRSGPHLLGLQAQVPFDPYTALWSRLDGFQPEDLARWLEDRSVVRTVLMRGTIHLVTAEDCLGLRALFQPVLDKELARHPDHSPRLA